ncbi:6-phosphogluconolactonase [Sulfurimonas sp. HSL-3221]|uniref:6-phosphogluconolactonase n=1 Tax=Sulfurimonadaceae TaxID=2771471 RepID=UPI001E31ABC0|nr:6-phosphogluconolactonase [Sulfurimonas sp. HSL-3221]UFS62542.1 6-phosphogluconolactonase [Sulfurimonas sp. HSL-3221]
MKSTETVFHIYDSLPTLHKTLAYKVARDLDAAIAEKGSASLLLSGGNTPRPFLVQLAAENVDWSLVTVGLVDERWVDPESGASNENLVRSELLANGAEAATFVGMYRPGETAAEAVAGVEAAYKAFFPFDVVVLGMGSDGHTASLFPGRPELEGLLNDAALCGAAEAPTEPKERMSLSLHAIAAAAHCYLHIEGGAKLAVYEAALDGDDVAIMPVRAVLNHPDIALEVFYA